MRLELTALDYESGALPTAPCHPS